MGIIPFRRRARESAEDAGESTTIQTMGGVESVQQPPGEITVSHQDGDTIVELLVDDGEGGNVAVFLDWRATVDLMATLGATAVKL